MDAGVNNVIYMELHSGPKMANSICGKTIVVGMIDRGSTVMHPPDFILVFRLYERVKCLLSGLSFS